MHNRALLGWLLAGGFSASVSCGGSDGGGIPGFGLPCETDKECTGYDLLCDVNEEKCVQCFAREDCGRAEACVAGQCQEPQSCDDSRDCPSDQVCAEPAGVCVQCLTTRDCPTGQKCAAQACVDSDFCEFTSDCDDGLLCDTEAGICVTCRDDDDCPSSRVCTDHECLLPGMGGAAGDGGTGATAGTEMGGSGGTRAGSNSGGRGGSSGSTSGTGGSSGNPPVCDCEVDQACTVDDRCVSAGMIDDFVDSCDDQILAIEGRSGPWYGAADTDVNITVGFGDPGTLWVDHTCAAWATGGAKLNGTLTEFAILALMLAEGSYYDLSGYTGVQVVLESDNPVDVVLKTSVGLFRYSLPYVQPGSNLRTVPFSQMVHDTSLGLNPLDYIGATSEIQFAAPNRASFGFAVHRVELY